MGILKSFQWILSLLKVDIPGSSHHVSQMEAKTLVRDRIR